LSPFSVLHNYFNRRTKLFSDLVKFLDASTQNRLFVYIQIIPCQWHRSVIRHIKNFDGPLSIRNADKLCAARQLYDWFPGICNAIGPHEEFRPASRYILDDVRATKLVVAL